MNPSTITMDPLAAADKAKAYREALARRPNDEYAAALTIYDALAEGLTLLDVGVAIREGGFDDQMRPRLALARADRRQVHFEWRHYSDVATFDTIVTRATYTAGLIERVNFNRRHGMSYPNGNARTVRGYALVPMIPADVRPPGQDRNWHILWEVDAWADAPLLATPPHDPYLLRRIRGDIFAVLAQWDLTEVERLVMAGRARVQS